MGNKTLALEWLRIAFHDLQSAKILYDAHHYTDSIGSDLQQSLEKILKSMFAFENRRVLKSHNLLECYISVESLIGLDENEIDLLDIATKYLKEERYPNPHYALPTREEIKEVLEFTDKLFYEVLTRLDINIASID